MDIINLHPFISVCASRPWTVLFLGFLFIVSLGHGIKYMHVTTDPVELWASPNSRSRVEKEYFDSHFEPFYRTEQIIISAIGLPDVSWYIYVAKNWKICNDKKFILLLYFCRLFIILLTVR